jgi:hypothetical protein
MTELDMVISAAERTLAKAREFAAGPDIHPDHYPALVQAIGLFEAFRDELDAVRSEEMP